MIYSSLNNGFPLIYSSGEVDFKGIVLQFRVCAEYDTSLLNSIVSEPIRCEKKKNSSVYPYKSFGPKDN